MVVHFLHLATASTPDNKLAELHGASSVQLQNSNNQGESSNFKRPHWTLAHLGWINPSEAVFSRSIFFRLIAIKLAPGSLERAFLGGQMIARRSPILSLSPNQYLTL
ncbi:hypothetical protein PCANC_04558 [Puccinia coronata f. sp. avenae]|uniref:Uncharacterized protein n=1 Tax=Puccinia coronata f. sp. avenae TaxID=200324 RepID=A0A2N5T1L0_9BASI|nr:hypothetical protein PCANC_09142 [Puccinia coronata f. sp. avenae]PLW54194.1 hypothetical protein PCANC_04558 [Puccinia coronata f. sp. avenae]